MTVVRASHPTAMSFSAQRRRPPTSTSTALDPTSSTVGTVHDCLGSRVDALSSRHWQRRHGQTWLVHGLSVRSEISNRHRASTGSRLRSTVIVQQRESSPTPRNDDGFTVVWSHRSSRWRQHQRALGKQVPPPVASCFPSALDGRCLNYLPSMHRVARCHLPQGASVDVVSGTWLGTAGGRSRRLLRLPHGPSQRATKICTHVVVHASHHHEGSSTATSAPSSRHVGTVWGPGCHTRDHAREQHAVNRVRR
jgi:hypothetical protein